MQLRSSLKMTFWLAGTAACTKARWCEHAPSLEPERVTAFRDHGERNRVPVATRVHVLGLKPGAEPRIVDVGPALPELGSQSALDPEVIQL